MFEERLYWLVRVFLVHISNDFKSTLDEKSFKKVQSSLGLLLCTESSRIYPDIQYTLKTVPECTEKGIAEYSQMLFY